MTNEAEEHSLSADLAAAWDASEDDSDGTEQQGGQVPEPDSESGDAAERSAAGSESPADGADNEDPIRGDADTAEGVDSVPETLEKPPVGLSLEAREEWANTPPAVQAAIAKREKDYEAGIVKYAENAKRAEAMDQSLQPYQQLFAMNGGVGNTLPGLLQTASMLQMGSGPQKAQAVANIIKQFGVDIRSLDNMLVGDAPPAEAQQQDQVQQAVQQAIQPYQQMMNQMQTNQQQQVQHAQQQVNEEVNTFAADHEFYNDVRADMADLLDMATNRGRQMSMEEAYKTACSAHPQISKIVSARAAQESVAEKRKAASSIRGNPGGQMGGAAPGSVADALNEAWDNAGRM